MILASTGRATARLADAANGIAARRRSERYRGPATQPTEGRDACVRRLAARPCGGGPSRRVVRRRIPSRRLIAQSCRVLSFRRAVFRRTDPSPCFVIHRVVVSRRRIALCHTVVFYWVVAPILFIALSFIASYHRVDSGAAFCACSRRFSSAPYFRVASERRIFASFSSRRIFAADTAARSLPILTALSGAAAVHSHRFSRSRFRVFALSRFRAFAYSRFFSFFSC